MKKTAKFLFIIVCVALAGALCACSEPSFGDLVIYAEDQTDVPDGEYVLEYSVKDYETFKKLYGLQIDVKVFDESGNSVEVTNNRTIKVEKSKTYAVNVVCTATVNGVIKEKIKKFYVVAEKKDPTVYFYTDTVLWRTVVVGYGETLDMSEVPAIPDQYPEPVAGYTLTLKSKRWTVTIGNTTYDLEQAHLTCITSDVKVVGVYEYDRKLNDVKIEYETDGGSEVDTVTVPYSQTVGMPDSPTKDGYIFDGWYTDEERTQLFDWTVDRAIKSLKQNYKLYAKWLPWRHPEVNANYSFELACDTYGYEYYKIKFTGTLPADGVVILPDGKDNVPVRGFSTNAFANTAITSVTVPARYDRTSYYAFRDCTALTEVVFESGCLMTSIDAQAFYNCTSLVSIALPENITLVDISAFEGCTALRTVTLPSTLLRISEKAFKSCSALERIAIPDKVTTIFQEAFVDCSALSEVIFTADSKLTFISRGAFDGTNITAMTLPYACKANGVNPFSDESVTVDYFPKPEE